MVARRSGAHLRKSRSILNAQSECVRCGSTDNLEVDHIKPYYLGGSNNKDNLQVLCKVCHLSKTKATPKNKRKRIDLITGFPIK